MRADPAALIGIRYLLRGSGLCSSPPAGGFPVVTTTVTRIHRMLADAGLLTSADVAPLVILDIEALEAVEAIGENGGLTLPELLAAHEQSQLSAHGFREWLIATHPGTDVPSRIRAVWSRMMNRVLNARRRGSDVAAARRVNPLSLGARLHSVVEHQVSALPLRPGGPRRHVI
jgi:hypothetical protein